MKPDIHPNYHVIKVVMTNGEEYITRSTYGVDGGDAASRHRPQHSSGLDRRLAATDGSRRPVVAFQLALRRSVARRQEVGRKRRFNDSRRAQDTPARRRDLAAPAAVGGLERRFEVGALHEPAPTCSSEPTIERTCRCRNDSALTRFIEHRMQVAGYKGPSSTIRR